MTELTPRQDQVIRFIVSEVEARGFPPTISEIMGHLDIGSRQSVQRHLEELKAKGYIERAYGVSRGIRVRIDPDNEKTKAIKLADSENLDLPCQREAGPGK